MAVDGAASIPSWQTAAHAITVAMASRGRSFASDTTDVTKIRSGHGPRLTFGCIGPRSPRFVREAEPLTQYRLRFYTYNMGNNFNWTTVDDLQDPGGDSVIEHTLRTPFGDGQQPDVVSMSFPETRLGFSKWVKGYIDKYGLSTRRQQGRRDDNSAVDTILVQNARREGGKGRDRLLQFVEKVGTMHGGNLKSVLGFRGSAFWEDEDSAIFERLTEATIAGISVPNPKKAFIGRTLVDKEGHLRLCFLSAHFPIAQIANALEDDSQDPLMKCKAYLARTLRKVLKKVAICRKLDPNMVIFVQGDLNSRTVLSMEDGGRDILLEALSDHTLQNAICNGLSPKGAWYELAPTDTNVRNLPVTYKFNETGSSDVCLGEILSSFKPRLSVKHEMFEMFRPSDGQNEPEGQSCLYRNALLDIGDEKLAEWGLTFKKNDWRPFRFPASADRILYWAPHSLADRIRFTYPNSGYEVIHAQNGSDHRPVVCEVVMELLPPNISRHGASQYTQRSDSSMDVEASELRSSECFGIPTPCFGDDLPPPLPSAPALTREMSKYIIEASDNEEEVVPVVSTATRRLASSFIPKLAERWVDQVDERIEKTLSFGSSSASNDRTLHSPSKPSENPEDGIFGFLNSCCTHKSGKLVESRPSELSHENISTSPTRP
eukprot:TRINITY_DN42194_c0_g1_i1.p1 TRINITY_DN42194_c0_g1~~TRINITY_DN42194_c0_g1_i1.p1  ORF type:complete len:675 (-),score=102.98 TRINITY_DN42194_c0_g1_i1:26-2002(-)